MQNFVAEYLCRQILACLGGTRVLLIGEDVADILARLLDFGLDAHALVLGEQVERLKRLYPARIASVNGWNFPYQTDAFDTVLVCDFFDSLGLSELPSVMAELCRIARVNFIITTFAHPTADIEEAGFALGLRRHLSLMEIAGYENLNPTIWQRSVCMELSPPPLSDAAAEKRMELRDVSRRSGAQADAGLARYHRAAWRVAPGDTVLDIGCGAGYGAAMLERHTKAGKIIGVDCDPACIDYAQRHFASFDERLTYQNVDASSLPFLPDNCVDVVTVFGVFDEMSNPDAILKEIGRVLKKGGRVIVSVRNMWGEPGQTLALWNWEKLRTLFQSPDWIIEQQQIQTAGSHIKLANAQRLIRDFPADAICPDEETEWCLLTVVRNPIDGTKADYTSRLLPELENNPDYHFTNWKRDYDNPALFSALICRGVRLGDSQGLVKLAESVIAKSRAGSADSGGALCVLAYQMLEHKAPWAECEALLARMKTYVPELNNKQALRWRVSLDFVAGLMCQSSGLMQEAQDFFKKVASVDVADITPTLGTKTVQARRRLADICFGANKREEALFWLKDALIEARHLLTRDWLNVVDSFDAPNRDGLREMTAVAEQAALVSVIMDGCRFNPYYSVCYLPRYYRRPDLESSRDYETEVEWRRSYVDWLQRELDTERARTAELEEELRRLQAKVERIG